MSTPIKSRRGTYPGLEPAGTISDEVIGGCKSHVQSATLNELAKPLASSTAANWYRLSTLWRSIYIFPLSGVGLPSNHQTILFRTINQLLGDPNCNKDYLAVPFRDNLISRWRAFVCRHAKWVMKLYKMVYESNALGVPGIINFVDVRTQWLDNLVERAINQGLTQVVLVAAGYDTRPYRFARPGVTFFEVDLPHASLKKRKLVDKLLPEEQYPRPVYVAADLSKTRLQDALAAVPQFSAAKPSLITIEGLLYYLPPDAVTQLFACTRAIAAPGSLLAFDFLHNEVLEGRVHDLGFEIMNITVQLKGEPHMSGLDNDTKIVKEMLESVGFRLRAMMDAQYMTTHYNPHLKWDPHHPPIASFYGYVEAYVPPLAATE